MTKSIFFFIHLKPPSLKIFQPRLIVGSNLKTTRAKQETDVQINSLAENYVLDFLSAPDGRAESRAFVVAPLLVNF